MEELITVIIAVYKGEKYISKCLDSILRQSYSNLEIILVPQPGGDISESICREYEKRDGRIRVLPQTMCDLSHARNYAISNAKGKYVVFVDQDDMVNERYVEILYETLIKYDADISICRSYAFIDENNISLRINENYENVHSGREMCVNLLKGTYGSDIGVIQTKLYKRGLFDNIQFPEGNLNDDGGTNYRIYWPAEKVVVIGQKLYYYRSQRKDSITHMKSDKRYRDTIISSRKRCCFYKEKGEQWLYDYAVYTLCNDIIRARYFVRNDADYVNALKCEQKEQLRLIQKSDNISKTKKVLSVLGYKSPQIWMTIWKARRKYNHFVEWKIKGARK